MPVCKDAQAFCSITLIGIPLLALTAFTFCRLVPSPGPSTASLGTHTGSQTPVSHLEEQEPRYVLPLCLFRLHAACVQYGRGAVSCVAATLRPGIEVYLSVKF